ncbi:MAG: TonB-dependent receptor plug domain-containing protein [Alphaproteobacteria bacterium]|nr:TonB-dependent receptor plug domain-containing protein [Alphaproteobacteria bacterium]
MTNIGRGEEGGCAPWPMGRRRTQGTRTAHLIVSMSHWGGTRMNWILGEDRASSRSARLLRAAASGLAALGVGLAVAATASAAPIETVTVEARGVEESVRDIPVAITAVNEKTLQNYSLNNLQDVAAHTPSLEILKILSGTGTSISIRGISSSAGSLGIEQSVAVIIDGVYFPQGRVINEGLYDVSQVAILKGPQALYFGKNATAGVISITTNDPGQEFEAMAQVGYEVKTESLKGQGFISVPVNDKWGFRLAVEGTKMWGGWLTNTAPDTKYTTFDVANNFAPTVHDNPAPTAPKSPGTENFQTRLTLKATPTDRLTLRLKGSYADDRINQPGALELVQCNALDGVPHRSVGTVPNQMPVPAGVGECNKDWRQGSNPIPPDIAKTRAGLNRFGGQLGEEYKSYIVTGDADYALDWVDIRAILNFHRQNDSWVCDCDGGADTSTFAQEHNTFTNYSAELRAATSFDGPVNGVLGFYYQHTHRYFEQSVHFAGAENSAAAPDERYTAYDKVSETTGETVSAYGELKWDITDQWRLTGGARYLWERKNSYFIQPYVNPAYSGLFVQGRNLTADQRNDTLIPEVTLTWKPVANWTFYVAYKKGYKSGGFDNGAIDSTLNANPVDDITFDPEHVKGFEGGIKALLADGTLSFELDGYTYKYNDLQLNFFNAPIFAYVTLNAGGARTSGAELQVTWDPKWAEGLSLNASLAYDDAHYTDFIAPCSGGESPAQGCTIQNGGLFYQQLAGQPRNLAPKWAGNFGFNYEQQLGNSLRWSVSGNVKWKSKYSLSEFIPNSIQNGYAMLDAAIRIGAADETWTFAVIGKNLTNHYVLVGTRDAAGSGGNTGYATAFPSDLTGYPLEPRTIEFQLTFRY